MEVTGGRVAIVMGSQSDWPTMKAAADVLDELEVAYEARITSAHRTPDRMVAFANHLPVDYKVRGQKLRWFFKEALRGFGCLTKAIAHLIGNCANGGGTLRRTETSIEIESLPFILHVTARQVRGDREVQDRGAAFTNRRAPFALCALHLNRFGEQL